MPPRGKDTSNIDREAPTEAPGDATRSTERTTPVDKTKPAKAERACACGCSLVGSGEFRAGHDAVWKSRLLKDARAGNSEARSELIRRGWATNERIDARPAKASAVEVTERKQARLQAKAERLRAELLAIEGEIDALTSSQAVA